MMDLKRIYDGSISFHSTPGALRHEFGILWGLVSNWAFAYNRGSLEDLPADQKQALLASLDGFCVQGDWDRVIPRLPLGAQMCLGHVAVQAMIFKHIATNLVDQPFWCLDGKIDTADTEGDPDFARRLKYFYERVRIGNPDEAAWWKSHTIALCHMSPQIYGHIRGNHLGEYHRARTRAWMEELANELLGRELFQLVSPPPKTAELQQDHREGGHGSSRPAGQRETKEE
ncbi:hypothetical protein BO71DRAFT_489626 [Aspergillus ellipticus CBS 707.79]|uniref:Uncharacterized protein n=1 Tax=Aspergillus ellipticus CBS 707.79 TaxID=1448320 RepID=A0A319CPS0_9EURO|nr:hypothetical protein BO71DRAFT_489626 [Aspergillus ellipticus CBS 707.79]